MTIARPTGVRSGDVLVAAIDVRGSASIASAAGWTQVQTNVSGTSLRQAVFVHSVGSAEPTSY